MRIVDTTRESGTRTSVMAGVVCTTQMVACTRGGMCIVVWILITPVHVLYVYSGVNINHQYMFYISHCSVICNFKSIFMSNVISTYFKGKKILRLDDNFYCHSIQLYHLMNIVTFSWKFHHKRFAREEIIIYRVSQNERYTSRPP